MHKNLKTIGAYLECTYGTDLILETLKQKLFISLHCPFSSNQHFRDTVPLTSYRTYRACGPDGGGYAAPDCSSSRSTGRIPRTDTAAPPCAPSYVPSGPQGCGSKSGSGSRRAKMTHHKSRKIFLKVHVLKKCCTWPLLRAEGFFCNLNVLYGGRIGKL